jgi:hypothetical protein
MIFNLRHQNKHAMMEQRQTKKYWVGTKDTLLNDRKVYGKCKRPYISCTICKVHEAAEVSTNEIVPLANGLLKASKNPKLLIHHVESKEYQVATEITRLCENKNLTTICGVELKQYCTDILNNPTAVCIDVCSASWKLMPLDLVQHESPRTHQKYDKPQFRVPTSELFKEDSC